MKKLLILIIILSILPLAVYSQSLKFAELAPKLERFFSPELIKDIQNQLPQSDYNIWGWGVGDFSGDGYYDFAVSVDIRAKKGRNMDVFMFVDIEGYMVKVGQKEFEYVEMPLEVGVVIKNNTCYITQKFEQFHWIIRGYTFDNGSLALKDETLTERIGKLTHETYKNYLDLKNEERYFTTSNESEKFNVNYMSLPVYPRGKKIYKGYQAEAFNNFVDYVPKGAYWWTSDSDASYTIRAAYDEQYIYFQANVNDESIIHPSCDTCAGDYLTFWFDSTPFEENKDRFLIGSKKDMNFRTLPEEGIYMLNIFPGNFLDKKAYVEFSSSKEMEAFQKIAAHTIKAVSTLSDSGYIIKFKIPFHALGVEPFNKESRDLVEYGATFLLHDVDNEFRPEEETIMTTSIFDESNPTTYGSLIFIPYNRQYGSSENIFQNNIISKLKNFGF